MTAITTAATTDPVTGGPTLAPAERSAGVGATVIAVATRTVRKYMRTPQLLVYSLVAGAIFLVLFRYILGGAIHFESVPYVDFLVPGWCYPACSSQVPALATGVAEDVEQGFFDRLRSLPAPESPWLVAACWATPLSWPGARLSPLPWASWLASASMVASVRRSSATGCASSADRLPVDVRLHGLVATTPKPLRACPSRLPRHLRVERLRPSRHVAWVDAASSRTPAHHDHVECCAVARPGQPHVGRTRKNDGLLGGPVVGLVCRPCDRFRPAGGLAVPPLLVTNRNTAARRCASPTRMRLWRASRSSRHFQYHRAAKVQAKAFSYSLHHLVS